MENKKALYGLRTSPIAWKTERDTTLKSLRWFHLGNQFRLLPCAGSPCVCKSVVLSKPNADPDSEHSGSSFSQGIVITYVDDLLITGWQYHIDSITKLLLAKFVMKSSGKLPMRVQSTPDRAMVTPDRASEGSPGVNRESSNSSSIDSTLSSESIGELDFLGARITRDLDGTIWCDQTKYVLHCLRENGLFGADGRVSLKKTQVLPSIDEKLGEEEGRFVKRMRPWQSAANI